jgi:hypothetical protein
MVNRKAANVVAVLVIAGAWLWLYLWSHPHPPDIDPRPHQGVGQVLGAEAVQLLEPGARLIVLARDADPYEVPAAEVQLEAFLAAVHKAGVKVAAIRSFKLDPLRPIGVPASEFFELLRQAQSNDVIVSFLGPPVLSAEQLSRLGNKRPIVLALCAGAMPAQVDLKSLFDQRLLRLAVVSRPDAPAQAGPGDSRAAFDQMFKLITPANAAELADLAAAWR